MPILTTTRGQVDFVGVSILRGTRVTPAETMKIEVVIDVGPVKNVAACIQPYLEMGGWDAG